jgi:hypothetical protein
MQTLTQRLNVYLSTPTSEQAPTGKDAQRRRKERRSLSLAMTFSENPFLLLYTFLNPTTNTNTHTTDT